MRAWMQAPGEIESLDGWLRAVARNAIRGDLRRRDAEARALSRVDAPCRGPSVDEVVISRLAWAEWLDRLPNGQRDAVVLHYGEDRRIEDVAALLGVTPGTVKTQLHRARAALASILRSGPDPRRRTMTVKDWFMAGDRPRDYEFGLAEDERHEGKRVVTLRCVAEAPGGFGTLMQQCAPDDYIGHRVRFSGAARSRDVGRWAGLWFRVDGAARNSLAFDNMEDRPIKGTTDWARYEVVLDVAEEATLLAYGVLLSGDGEVDVADFRFEKVGTDVPLTDRRHRLGHPSNLDFSED